MQPSAGIEVPSIWANSSSGISSSNAALANTSCRLSQSPCPVSGAADAISACGEQRGIFRLYLEDGYSLVKAGQYLGHDGWMDGYSF